MSRLSGAKKALFFSFIFLASLVLLKLTALFSQTPPMVTFSVGNEPRGLAINPATNKAVVTNHNTNTVTVANLSNNTTATVTVGQHPYGVAINPNTNKAYIANEKSDTVSVLNLSNNSVSATIPVGMSPKEIAVNPATATAVVANSKSDTVSILNLGNNTVSKTLSVGVDPEGVVINTANNRAFVTHFGSDSVSVIDLGTKTVTATLATGSGPSGIALHPTTQRIVVANRLSDTVSIFNGSNNALIATISVGAGPTGVAIHPGLNRAYISNTFSDSISVIDLSSNSVIATYPAGRDPEGIAVVSQVNLLLVVNAGGDTVSVINLSNPPSGSIVPVGKDPTGVAIDRDANVAVTANAKSNDLSVVDLSTGAMIATLPAGKNPQDVAIHPTSKKLISANTKANTVSIYDLPSRTLLATVPVGKSPRSVAIDPILNIAAVANERDGTLSLIDLSSHIVTATIPAGSRPTDIDIHPGAHLAVVANKKNDIVTILDLANRITVGTVAVGKDPVSIAIHPATNIAAVANKKSNTLSIINLATNTVSATINVVATPTGVAINSVTNIAVVVSHETKSLQRIDLSTNTVLTPTLPAGWEPEQVAIHPDTNVGVVTNQEPGAVAIVPLPNPVPLLDTLSPESVSASDPGFTLTLNGSRFLKTSTVNFNGQTYPSQFISNNQIQADLPASAISQAGSVLVSVTNPAPEGGTSNSLAFTISNPNNPIPALSALSPGSVTAGAAGFTLTVNGNNFISSSSVSLNNQTMTTTYLSPTQLTASVPAQAIAAAGVFSVTVTNPAPGGGTSNVLSFTVNNPLPSISTIAPPLVETGSGPFTLTVNGSGFVTTSSIALDGQSLLTTFVNSTELTASVPDAATATPHTAEVTVTNPPPGGGTSNIAPLLINTPPTADGGNNQSATVGKIAALDGRRSTDPDFDRITFAWSLLSSPAGSTAALINPTSVRPSLTPDLAGNYQIQLIVNDGKTESLPVTVTVTAFAVNAPPNADAGLDQAAVVGQAVTLDGRESSDPDDDRISYAWSLLSAPSGSSAALAEAASVIPSLTPDLAGVYVIRLVVNDGNADGPGNGTATSSLPDTVLIVAASPNAAPVARAGKDRNTLTGNPVTLNGSASRDPNGDPLSHQWTFVSTPAASAATLTGAATATPSFTPDVSGEYLIRLVVNDGASDSLPDTVLIVAASPNAGPNAVSGADQTTRQSDTVTLDATGASDPNGDPITYRWLIVSAPSGSEAALSDAAAAQPTFIADVAGSYVFRLGVNDGASGSVPDTVVVTVMPIASLVVTPANPSITQGEVQQFSATANFPDSTTKDVTALVIWSSSDTTIATIDAAGLATSLKGGMTQIRAAYGTVTSPEQTLTVINLSPSFNSFAPASGTVGTAVTITGNNFNTATPSDNKLFFNGAPAIISAVTATTITTVVPLGATTGPITLTTSGGSATSATPFTVTPKQDFTLTASPAQTSVVQGKTTTYQIRVNSAAGDFLTHFVQLSAASLPTGVTAVFNPPQVSGGQLSTLTVTTTASASAGNIGITISGTASLEGKTVVRQATLQLLVVASGGTTLSGRVLASKDDRPIPGAKLKLGGQVATTDESGNFLFSNPPIGDQVILLDGPTSAYPADLPVPVTIATGVANDLLYPIYLHEVSQEYVTIVPGQEAIVNPPNIPDFSMHIPQGTTIMGWDGQPNTQVSVTPVPIDRLPIRPIPEGVQTNTVYMFNFNKPGGGYPTRPIPIVLPNDLGGEPGDRVNLWYYDESPEADPNSNQWRIYGQGTISQDGKTIIPDPGVGQPKFCCGGGFAELIERIINFFLGSSRGGDPVDLSSGAFVLEETDMVLPGILPLEIKRTYRTRIQRVGAFGVGSSFNYDLFVRPSGNQAVIYIASDGNRYTFSQGPDGSYTNSNYPFLAGTTVTRLSDGRTLMKSRDGSMRIFNGAGWLVEMRDRNNNRVVINRSSTTSMVTQIIDASGRELTFSYIQRNGIPVISSITDPTGRVVRYDYDNSGRLTSITDPTGGVTTYTYDGDNRIISIIDARGITFLTNEYDTNGRVIKQTQADGSVYTFRYTLAGNTVTQTEITDPNGNTTTRRFNSRQYLARIVDANGQMTRLERDFSTNQVMAIYDPMNRKKSFTYDLNGNTTSIVDPAGNTSLMEYEQIFNQPIKLTNALNQTTLFSYDPNGNLLTTTDSLGNETTISYNEAGQPITITDALGNTTRFEYDEVGNLITSIDPLGNKIERSYDLVSRLIRLTDANGKTTSYSYDGLNRVIEVEDPILGLNQLTYDPNGNLLAMTDAQGQTTTHTYDSMDRLETRTDPLNRIEQYSYDPGGNLKTYIDRKGQIATFDYDRLNRNISSSFADGSRTSYAYDTVGRLFQITDSLSGEIMLEYDFLLNRLIREVTPLGSVEYGYDALGRRTQMVVNGQQPITYSYDANSRMTQIAQGIQTVGIDYDAVGRRTTLSYSNDTTASYSYDAASGLTDILHQGPTSMIEALDYTYDAAGNRLSYARANGTLTLLPDAVQAVYDAANEQVQFDSDTPNLTYDANGNLISQTDSNGTTTYTWDARNRLIAMSSPNISASFGYDALGRRVSKTINGQKTDYLYDKNDVVVEISGGIIEASYIRSLSIDEPFVRQGVTNEYYHVDALGSVLALSDGTGGIQTTYSYEPFGETSTVGTSTNPFQYTGRENDKTGLYYYRARYYSPIAQRFISPDPLKGQSGNTYAYAENTPINAGDPLGLFCVPLPSIKGPWENIRELGAEDIWAAEGVLFINCAWQRNKIIEQKRSIKDRSLCCDFCKKGGVKCRTVESDTTRFEYREIRERIEFRTNRGSRLDERICCTNPWTGRASCIEAERLIDEID